ncbi:hypothetical protein HMPREF1022_00969, partial [Desulfovibrio sp. 6_1_46AFAA]
MATAEIALAVATQEATDGDSRD